MDENEYALKLHDIKVKLEAAARELLDMMDEELTDDQAEHCEDLAERIGHATAIMA